MQNRYSFLCLGLLLFVGRHSIVPVPAIDSAYANTNDKDVTLTETVPFMPSSGITVVDAGVATSVQIDPAPATVVSFDSIKDEIPKPSVAAGPVLPASTAVADFRSIPSLRQHLPLDIPDALDLSESQKRDVECVAWNLYFEARGGQHNEQVAIAYVPINRIGKKDFGNDVCTNVFQYNVHNGIRKYQFSWIGFRFGPHWAREDDAWKNVQKIAVEAYLKSIPDAGKGATYFHSLYLTASWAPHQKKIVIGQHLFWVG
jgi:hypothetical protein